MTLHKGLTLLQLFADHGPRLSFRDLTTLSKAHRSSVYRLVSTLTKTGFLHDLGHNTYRLGPALAVLGAVVDNDLNVRHIALDVMSRVAEETRETVHLTLLDGDEAVFAEAIDSPLAVRHHIQVGRRVPLNAGASAKAILAFLPHDRVSRYLRRPLRSVTPRTITNPRVLRQQLALIRADGYCITNGEAEPGATGIAAPIRDRDGVAQGALTVSFPAGRYSRSQVASLRQLIVDASEAVARRLGWQSSSTKHVGHRPRST